jgi:hypothetical protein
MAGEMTHRFLKIVHLKSLQPYIQHNYMTPRVPYLSMWFPTHVNKLRPKT